jgi:hypothetical protein
MAEVRCVGGRPTNALKRYLEEISANTWFDKNVDRTEDLTPYSSHLATGPNGASLHDNDDASTPVLDAAPVPGKTTTISLYHYF